MNLCYNLLQKPLIFAPCIQISQNLERQCPDNPAPLWRGADIINKQSAQLAINNLKQQYCQPLVSTSSTTSANAADQSTTSASTAAKSTESRPTTQTSDPYQLQPPNP